MMVSPIRWLTALAAEVRRLRGRDAINWLFKDEYQLHSDSPDNARWDESSGSDF